MRITCNQCGKDLQSESCKRTCDENKRWKQFNEALEELKKLSENMFRNNQNRKNNAEAYD